MFNLIKMDLYRLIHSLSTWVLLVFVIAVALFNTYMTNLDLDMMENDVESETVAAEQDEVQFGISVAVEPEWIDKIEYADFLAVDFQSGFLLIFCAIFSAIFVNAEYKNGYIKNIAGQLPDRGLLALSKLIVIAVQTLVIVLVHAASTGVFCYAFFGDKLYFGSVTALLKIFAVQYLLHFGFASLIALLCILTRSTAFSMVTGIFLSCGVGNLIYALINRLIVKINPSSDFNLSNYVLEGNISAVGIDAASEQILRAVIVGVIFLLISAVCSMLVMKKRDI